MKTETISRRQMLTRLSATIGGTLLPGIVSILAQAFSYQALANNGGVLTPAQMKTVSIISDIIIPRTDTPGAVDAGVPQFIDHLLTRLMSKEAATRFLNGLEAFMQLEMGFTEKSAAAQYDIVLHLDDSSWNEKCFDGFYGQLKALTLIGYYTSEVGASKELAFDPLPGEYRSFKLKSTDRTWST